MITQTLPAALPLRSWMSPDRNSQFKDSHVHAHGANQSRLKPPQVSDQSGLEKNAPVAPQSTDQLTRQLPAVQSVDSSLQVQDLSVAMSRSFNLEIKTKEDDVVTIAYKDASVQHQNAFEANNADGSVKGYQAESSSSSEFQISITGNLNEDEQKSLQDLMQQMQQVGTQFFQGDTKTAFQQAQKMGFDTEQIAGFSMSLNMEKSVRAVSAYQQISEQQPVDNKTLKQAGEFYNRAAQAMAGKSDILQLFADPTKVFNDLSSGIAESIAGQFDGLPDLAQHADTLKKLLNMFSGLISGDTTDNTLSREPKLNEPLTTTTA